MLTARYPSRTKALVWPC